MIQKEQLRELIRDVLEEFGHYSESAEELLMLTAAVESELGSYITQMGGPALGIFQMEPDTCKDIYNNWLRFKDDHFVWRVESFANQMSPEDNLRANLAYQIVFARIHYMRKSDPLPPADDTLALAKYWKKHYNTYSGRGTVEKALEAYEVYVNG